MFFFFFLANYFSSHFIMGGERFDTAQPEMYLFGENMDLNFLGSRPAPVSDIFITVLRVLSYCNPASGSVITDFSSAQFK